MITKEITLCGKQITLGYCYATEIAYKTLAGEDIHVLQQELIDCSTAKSPHLPDAEKCIYLILAAMQAYYKSRDEELPLTDKVLITQMDPIELGVVLGTIVNLWAEFYQLPDTEKKASDAEGDEKEKNS